MYALSLFLGVVAFCCHAVVAREVFAHFMLGNTLEFNVDEFRLDISLAQEAGIDAFAVNMGARDPTSSIEHLSKIFQAAELNNFKLMFSFDYAGNGVWAKETVLDFIKTYVSSPAYFKRGSQPLVSTFEGSDNAPEWRDIKSQTNSFFIPDYSSLGPEAALGLGVADGLFSWAAWPNGPNRMTTSSDEAYIGALGDRDYMMPVSPWFYTNLPNYGKNWAWRGDNLWYDRWNQAIALQPEYIQIITWNDFGEAHHIGPLNEKSFGAFQYGGAPFNYARDLPHDGWRKFLPYLISLYKTGTANVQEEGIVSWYRLNPGASCNSGGTTGNSAPQGQQLYPIQEVLEDRVMVSALLTAQASATVSIGGVSSDVTWDAAPGGSGLYHGSVSFGGRTGEVVVTIKRGDSTVAQMKGRSITTDCSVSGGFNNWNAWVGSS